MDIWDNPMVNNALKALSTDQLAEYKKMGENLYGKIDYNTNKILNNVPPPMEESVAYIEEGLKAGLLPEDLTYDEVMILVQAYGEKWYEKYDFKQHEVPEIGLGINAKREIDDAVEYKINEFKEQEKKKEKKKQDKKDIRKLNGNNKKKGKNK
jgi:hypothetical protein